MALTLPPSPCGSLGADLLGQKEQELALLRQQALHQLQQQVGLQDSFPVPGTGSRGLERGHAAAEYHKWHLAENSTCCWCPSKLEQRIPPS